jgi:ribokinase
MRFRMCPENHKRARIICYNAFAGQNFSGEHAMTQAPRICVVGSSNIDLLSRVPRLPKLGETLIGNSFHLGYGGKGANQAVMAAKLGAQVTMVTKLGRDVFGEGTLQNYRAQGIQDRYILFDDALFSGVAPIFVDESGRNFIVIIPGANLGLSPTDVQNAREAITQSQILICQLEIPIETTLEAFRVAKNTPVGSPPPLTILNPAPAAELPDELLQLTDICAPNETEAELLTNISVQSLEDAERAARKLQARGPRNVILTLGERGALVADHDRTWHAPAVKVDTVDSTGAGDAFIGALAVFLGEGVALEQAVPRANAAAALSVTKTGTQVSFPDRDRADSFAGLIGL